MIKKVLISLLFCLLFHQGFSQTFLEAYTDAFNYYSGSINASYTIEYVSLGKTTIIDKSVINIEQLNGVTYTEMEGIESFSLDSTSIIVDHTNKQIQLNIGLKTTKFEIQNIELIKKTIASSSRESTKKIDSKIHHTLYFNDQQYKEIIMVINAKTKEFERMVYVLSESIHNEDVESDEPLERFEIRFNNYKKDISELSHSLESFLKFDGQRFSLQQKYSTYQFVNNYDLH